MKAYCYWCVEHKECRLFQIVNVSCAYLARGLQRVPFCKRCARLCGHTWEKGVDQECVPQHERNEPK